MPTELPAPFVPASDSGWRLEHTYSTLPEIFHRAVRPGAVGRPGLVVFNKALAEALGLAGEGLTQPERAGIFTGNLLPEGAAPLAQAYAGHQFGGFTMLGDGRAILLGEQITPGGQRFDIQLKGPGLTPYSRGGDGRAALGPMLREYVISEAMHALGIPTTRSLAVATTGEMVQRQQRLPGAVLTRVAASHLRVGTFEFAAARADRAALQALADYAIQRHYPDAVEAGNPYLAFLESVIERQAALVARWLEVGFIHGVMNTDNMSICGETIDYGPCAFMDHYDPATVFSSIDHQGRYAYANQPHIAQWNLARFAETLLPLLDADEATSLALANAAIQGFEGRFASHRLAGMRRKLGLSGEEVEDVGLINDLLAWMEQTKADFTNTFRHLSTGQPVGRTAPDDPAFYFWKANWMARRNRQGISLEESSRAMLACNPAVIPRNHQVEAALAAAVEQEDFSVLQRLLAVLARPFAEEEDHVGYQIPGDPGGGNYQTYCGT